mmetsp:Transcript_28958/g.85653  ORF Transcript_28958/g.85653 Transcript_28958/m.85653 type:complete len:303 (-) Transcript_28958:1011-1919(-)
MVLHGSRRIRHRRPEPVHPSGPRRVRRHSPRRLALRILRREESGIRAEEVFQLCQLPHLPQRQPRQYHGGHLGARSQGGGRQDLYRFLQVHRPRVRRTLGSTALPRRRPPRDQGVVLHPLVPLGEVRDGTHGAGSLPLLAQSIDRIQESRHPPRVDEIRQGSRRLGGSTPGHLEGEASGYRPHRQIEEGLDAQVHLPPDGDGAEAERQVQGRILQGIFLLPQGGDMSGLRISGPDVEAPVLRNVQDNGGSAVVPRRVRVAMRPGAEGDLLPVRADEGTGAGESVSRGVRKGREGGHLRVHGH